jgi:FtsP/CotA-like multicopper oxidase with cupredoxin domain
VGSSSLLAALVHEPMANVISALAGTSPAGPREVRLGARFEGFRGKYVFHCHNLEHEDMRVMANFEVI